MTKPRRRFNPALRSLLRMAARSVRSAPMRSALITVLIAILVTAGTTMVTLARTTTSTGQDYLDRQFGNADLVVSVPTTAEQWGRGPARLADPGSRVRPPIPYPGARCVETPASSCSGQQAVTESDVAAFDQWSAEFDGQAMAGELATRLGIDPRADIAYVAAGTFADSTTSSPYYSPFGSPDQFIWQHVSSVDPDHPLSAPTVRMVTGRRPLAPDEIAFDHDLSEDWGIAIGDRIGVGPGERRTVVGLTRGAGSSPVSLVHPSAFTEGDLAADSAGFRIRLSSSLDGSAAALAVIESTIGARINVVSPSGAFVRYPTGGWQAAFGAPSLGRGDETEIRIVTTMLTAAIGLQVALVASAAFAVAIHRRRREFAQLVTIGADQVHLRQLVLVEAGVLGTLGAVLGVVGGILASTVAIGQGWIESTTLDGGIRLSLVDWVGPALVGVGSALGAAWWPIRKLGHAATTIGVGSGPPGSPATKLPRIGGLVGLGGLIVLAATTTWATSGGYDSFAPLALMIIASIVATFVGLLTVIGTILARLGRHADRLPLLARLVVRSADRHRSRSWSIVGAFIITMSIPILIGASTEAYPNSWGDTPDDMTIFSLQTRSHYGGAASPTAVIDATSTADENLDQVVEQSTRFGQAFSDRVPALVSPVRAEPFAMLEATEWVLQSSSGGYVNSGSGPMVVATPSLVDLYDLSATAREALAQGQIVIASTNVPVAPTALRLISYSQEVPIELATVDFIMLSADESPPRRFGALVPPSIASELDIATVNAGWVFRTTDPLVESDERALRSLAPELWIDAFDQGPRAELAASQTWLTTPRRHSGPSATTGRLVALAIALAVAAVIALIASSLSAVEIDDEMQSMIATGAPPRTRRWVLGLQTLYYLLIAGALAIPSAIVVFWVATGADDWGPNGLTIPWTSIGLTIVVIPVVVAALVALLFRNGRPAVSRRIS